MKLSPVIAINNFNHAASKVSFNGCNMPVEKKNSLEHNTLRNYAGYDSNKQIYRWSVSDRLYNSYMKSKKFKSALEMLEKNNLTPDEAYSFLHKITSNSESAKKFITEITFDDTGSPAPEKSSDIVKKIVQKLGGKENFEKWYLSKGGYVQAFKQYLFDMYNDKNVTEAELCAYMPNWGPWTLHNRFAENGGFGFYRRDESNKYYPKDGFTLGVLPEEFGNKENYRNFVDAMSGYIKRGDTVGISRDIEKFGHKSACFLVGGNSGKVNIMIDGKYVLKIDNRKNKHETYYNELIDSQPDSLYFDSLVDYYITKHCKDASSKLYFYDNYSNSALYEYVEGKSPYFSDKTDLNKPEIIDINNQFKKLKKTGIVFTDRNPRNYVLTPNGLKCIDSGHAVFSDVLKPGAGGLTMSLPSRTGFNRLEFDARLYSDLNE